MCSLSLQHLALYFMPRKYLIILQYSDITSSEKPTLVFQTELGRSLISRVSQNSVLFFYQHTSLHFPISSSYYTVNRDCLVHLCTPEVQVRGFPRVEVE